MPNRGEYDKDTRVKAVRLVREHAGDYPRSGRRLLRCLPGWG